MHLELDSQLFNGSSQIPKVLVCDHTFCWNCIVATSIGRDPKVVCPTCGTITEDIYDCRIDYNLCERIENLKIPKTSTSNSEGLTDFSNIALTVDGLSFSMREDIRRLESLILSQNSKTIPDYESGLAEKQKCILHILKSKAQVIKITIASYLINHKKSQSIKPVCPIKEGPLLQSRKDFLSLRRWGIKENKFRYRGGFRKFPIYHMCSSPPQLGVRLDILKQFMIQLNVLRVSSKGITFCNICNCTVFGGAHAFVEHCLTKKHRGVLVHVVRTEEWCSLYLYSRRRAFGTNPFLQVIEPLDENLRKRLEVPDFLDESEARNDFNETSSPADFLFPDGIFFQEKEAIFIQIPSVCDVHQPSRVNYTPEEAAEYPCAAKHDPRFITHEERVYFKKTELMKWFNLYTEEADSMAQLTAVLERDVTYTKRKQRLLWREVADCINNRLMIEQANLFGGLVKHDM